VHYGIFFYDFINVKPPIEVKQEVSLQWLIERHSEHDPNKALEIRKRFLHYGVKKEKIGSRYFAFNDWLMAADKSTNIYSTNCSNNITYKADYFNHYAIGILQQFYPIKSMLPEHIIHVTCTGYVSPSAPQIVISNLMANCRVTHAYHMGCYAAFPASRIAACLVNNEESQKIDVVHTEACSLHMDATSNTPEQMVIQSLFADGNIKYSINKIKPPKPALELMALREFIIPESTDDMRWEIKQWGFAMTLSRLVPQKITCSLLDFIKDLDDDIGLPKEKLIKESIFAIHPGGPKIVEMVAQKLDLSFDQIQFSAHVLFERGNMSSATLPHVWEKILNSDEPDGRLITSLAFGPGLTIFGSVFKLRR
jgi:predicted naringenin-chalcone synthase